MPQTIEAISHAKAAKVPIIVAINKIDKPDADPDRVRNGLLQHEIAVEGYGGDVLDVEVSALKKTGLDKLEEGDPAAGRAARPQIEPEPRCAGRRHRGEAGARPRPGRDRAGAARHAPSRRHLRGRRGMGQGARPDRRQAAARSRPRARRLRSRCSASTARRRPATISRWSRTRAARARSPPSASARAAMPGAAAGSRGTLEQMFSKIAAGTRQGARRRRQVRRAGLARGDRRLARQDLDRRGRGARAASAPSAASPRATSRSPRRRTASSSASTSAPTPQAREIARRDGVEIRYYSIIYDLIDDVQGALSGMLAPTLAREVPRQCRDPRGVQHHESRQGRGLPRDGGPGQARRQGAPAARQRRHPRRHAQDAEPLQGRGARGPAKATNAAWRSRTTRTSASAT